MRYLLAALTLGVAGVGFQMLNPSIAAHSPAEESALRPLFDWKSDSSQNPSLESGPNVAELMSRAETRATKVLDDFVRKHGWKEQTIESAVQELNQAGSNALEMAGNLGGERSSVSDGSGLGDTASIVIAQAESPTIPKSVPMTNDVKVSPTSNVTEESGEELVSVFEVVEDAPKPRINASVEDVPSVEKSQEIVEATPQQNPVLTATDTPGATVKHATIVRGKPVQSQAPAAEVAPIADRQPAASPSKNQPVASANLMDSKAKTVGGDQVGKERIAAKVGSQAEAWKVVGKTTDGRPMHTRRFGDKGPRTLIVAGLDGEDRVAVAWIDLLADELVSRPELYQSNELLIFRAGNPDGLTQNESANSRGVLINRNFPSRRYRSLSNGTTGTGPATESETRVLLDTLYTFHPRRVIHLKATTAISKIFYNRAAKELAGELERRHDWKLQPIDLEQFPGSLEDFADSTLDASVFTMQLTVAKDWQQSWSRHRAGIYTALAGATSSKLDPKTIELDELARSSPEAVSSPIPISSQLPRPKIRSGYEELPPPPR